MIAEDMENYKKYFPKMKKRLECSDNILLLSPNQEQIDLMKRLFPESNIKVYYRYDWDLSEHNNEIYDLIVAMNVFHYSPNPDLWFRNVTRSCKEFWIQDLIYRVRGKNGEQYCNDGDCARYYFNNSVVDGAYDLQKQNLKQFVRYRDHKGSIHFIASVRGAI